VRALAAAASAADCAFHCSSTRAQALFLSGAEDAARDLLGMDHPAELTLPALFFTAGSSLSGNHAEAAASMSWLSDKRKRLFGASSAEAAATGMRLGIIQAAAGDNMSAAGSFSDALEALEETQRTRAQPRGDAHARKGLPPGRAGRDILAASTLLAGCLCELDDPRSASGVLARFIDDLPDLPAGSEMPARWPYPPELAGKAPGVAGKAAVLLDDFSRGEPLLRRAMNLLGQAPEATGRLLESLGLLFRVLRTRGDSASSLEAARLAERFAEFLSGREGADSADTPDILVRAAELREAAGDTDAAVGLRRGSWPRGNACSAPWTRRRGSPGPKSGASRRKADEHGLKWHVP
jgi:hypothetical protein